MEASCIAMLDMAKHCSTEYLTASRCISNKPCFVFNVIVTPDDPEDGSTVYLRNGENVNAEILMGLRGQYAHPSHAGCIPIYFNKGLYFDRGGGCKAITIQYYIGVG